MRAESITQAEASMVSQLRRWERMRDAIVAVMFSLTTLLGILGEPEVAGALPWMLGLSLLFMFWYGGVYTQIFRQHVAGRLLRTTFYFVIGVALWLVLIALDGPYLMYLFILLTIVFPILPERWALMWSIGLTAVAIWRQAMLAGSWLDPLVLTYLFAGASAIGIGLSVQAITRQNFERARLIDELRATRSALAASERESGILAERQRLAREIHDTLAQGFISIITHLEAADLAVPAGCADGRRHLRQAQTTARENLVDARRLVQDLRPMPLAEATLPDAVEAVGTRWAESWRGELRIVVTGDAYPLAEEVENTLLRATQEALHNVRKHADASEATITLSYMPDTVILDVYDNGRGFDATADVSSPGFASEGGFGLQAMRERAANVGGNVEIEGAPGDGTTVTVVVPIDPRGRSNAVEVQA